MKIKEDIIITGMSLDGYEFPVPEGLSELLNRSGAWVYKKSDELEEDNPLENYNRKVVLEDGKLRTYLNYKKTSSRSNSAKRIS